MQDKMLKCRTICKSRDRWQVCLLLLSMITCFISNQICHVGGSLWFLFDALLLYQKLLLVNTTHFVVTEQRMFGIGAHSLFG